MKSYAQRRSKLQEKRAARDMGGSVQKGSGSSAFAKGDFRKVGDIRGECKHTSKLVYVLKEVDLKKIQKEALQGGHEDWVMQVEFLGAVGHSKKFAIIDCAVVTEMWITRPSDYTYLNSDFVYTASKSYRLNVDEMNRGNGLHITQLTFVEESKPLTAAKTYAIIPWQAYLDLRKSYLEKR